MYMREITFKINYCAEEEIFPDDLKLAAISPIFRKEYSFSKQNHRPVSILPNLSKVFERILYKQIHVPISTEFSF